jgi:AcrR family transcriptional regulator
MHHLGFVDVVTRPRSQRGEGERLRTALLDAATNLLGETHDVESLSVRAVTARAGVSPTALYLHFADKDDLRRAVKGRCYAALRDALQPDETEDDRDPRLQLRAMAHAYLRFAREQPGLYAILFQTEVPNPAPRFSEDELRDRPGHEVFELVLGAVARCVDDETTAFDTACLAWMALHGRVAMQAAMPSFPFPDDDRFVALLIDGCVG